MRRDRAPLTGRNQSGIPIVSVNTPRAAVTISRIGDRNLVSALKTGNFLGQLEPYELEQIKDERGTEVWKGTVELGTELNKDVTTAFPATEAVGRLAPGVYVMTAKPDSQVSREDDYASVATQWFVVSDLGLTAFTGADGASVLLRSPASSRRAARAGSRRRWRSRPARTATTPSSTSNRARSTSPTAASRAASRPARSTPSSLPSAASTAPVKPCSSPRCCATERAARCAACR